MCYTRQARGQDGADLSFDVLLNDQDYALLVQRVADDPNNVGLAIAGFIAMQRAVTEAKDAEATAKRLGSAGACALALQILRALEPLEEVQFFGCQALRALSASPRNIFRLEALRVADHLHALLVAYPASARVVGEVHWTLDVLLTASEPLALRWYTTLDGIPLQLSVLTRYMDEPLAQSHGCRVFGAIARRFKHRLSTEHVADMGNHAVSAVVTHVASHEVVTAGVAFIELVCDKDARLFFQDAAWFRTVFATHLKQPCVLAEVTHLYRTLCHASPALACELAIAGGWSCVQDALRWYHDSDAPMTFDLLRLVHHLVDRLSLDDKVLHIYTVDDLLIWQVSAVCDDGLAMLQLVLACHNEYEDHEGLQVEVCCILRHYAACSERDTWATPALAMSLRHVMRLHPTSATLQRDASDALERLGL
ncbi:hypothetical protein SDRG_08396 [Saprolegnia diclina VS20]|uniref:Ataxin-10 domain-containing protein n=1 Tax=Saprolegnia diclina (strain VS20) TaxID=1156394 RepID=T0QK94_SAPDV|nr:hypothetical protein SDRG_08396 [Saprolegnia diclina VS20]EQC34190.1 hypothetical protein SDRG_08396 [Saprolegnia diclina VS20]|eukprot:XP_008612502.1 hypothetical protein SDRG_08396 [Saprolegnia diclina VS20]